MRRAGHGGCPADPQRNGLRLHRPRQAAGRCPCRAALLRRRGALWNTGLFAWGVARFLGEAGAYARELKTAWPKLSAGDVAGVFGAAQPVALDVAGLERTQRLPGGTGAVQWGRNRSWGLPLPIPPPHGRGHVIRGDAAVG